MPNAISDTATILPIVKVPDPVLKQVAAPIENISAEIIKQAQDMIATMYDAPGVGLAANQVGKLNRLFVMDTLYKKDDESTRKPIIMINPEIIWQSEEMSVMEEGCLSIPQQYAEVARPAQIRVKYINEHKSVQEFLAEGLASHCVQHELDHLNGVLFIDHLSRLKRNIILKKLRKYQEDNEVL